MNTKLEMDLLERKRRLLVQKRKTSTPKRRLNRWGLKYQRRSKLHHHHDVHDGDEGDISAEDVMVDVLNDTVSEEHEVSGVQNMDVNVPDVRRQRHGQLQLPYPRRDVSVSSSSSSSSSSSEPSSIVPVDLDCRTESDTYGMESGHDMEKNGTSNDSTCSEEEMDGVSLDPDIDPLNLEHGTINDLAREWILKQMGRNCSNFVCDDYFHFAWKYCHVFARLKEENGGKDVNLANLRKKVMKEYVPGIKMDFIYADLSLPKEEREQNPVHVYGCDSIPMKKFPPDKYELLTQATRINVRYL